MKLACLILSIVLAVGVASGQTHSYATKGSVELAGNISFTSMTNVSGGSTGSTISLFTLSPRVGFFPADGLEFGFAPGVNMMVIPSGLSVLSPEGGSSVTMGQLFGFAAYNFRLQGSTVVPFLEVPFGYTFVSSDGDSQGGFSWGARGGIKIVPTEHLLLTAAAEYWQLAFTPSGASDRSGLNVFTIGIGVGGYF